MGFDDLLYTVRWQSLLYIFNRGSHIRPLGITKEQVYFKGILDLHYFCINVTMYLNKRNISIVFLKLGFLKFWVYYITICAAITIWNYMDHESFFFFISHTYPIINCLVNILHIGVILRNNWLILRSVNRTTRIL